MLRRADDSLRGSRYTTKWRRDNTEANCLTLRNSEELSSPIEPLHGVSCHTVSPDTRGRYYSLDVQLLLKRTPDVFQDCLVQFRCFAGIAVAEFLRILELHLQSTVMSVNNQMLIRKDGVCIGSKVASVLSRGVCRL